MPALTRDQLELLQRAGAGLPMWGGSVAINRLRREVEFLHALRFIEFAGAGPYRLTALGVRVLEEICSTSGAARATVKPPAPPVPPPFLRWR